MDFSPFPKYFLAANSCEGFVSKFEDSYDINEDFTAYIIKGGAGCGKSTFMKFAAAKCRDKNFLPELFLCSSDPDSLDGVFLKDNFVMLDGTLPHPVEPKLTGVSETLLDTGRFLNTAALKENAEEIRRINAKNKTEHKTASRYIKAAGQMLGDSYAIQEKFLNFQKIETFSNGLCKNLNLKKQNKNSKISYRFLSGVTPKGIIFLSSTLDKVSDKQIIISDKYGAAANEILKLVLSSLIKNGYDVTVVPSAFFPLSRIEHLIIPELNMTVCCENDYAHLKTDVRRIHSRRFEEKGFMNYRSRLNFNKKAAKELLNCACETLLKAKLSHDELEKFYIAAMDFNEYNSYAAKIVGKLF